MLKFYRTLAVCALLLVGAASPAAAATGGGTAAADVHITGTSEGHTP